MGWRAIPVAAIALPLYLIAELLPIRSYTTADGLAADRIDNMTVDSHGFVWFCTREGLSRFDGYRIVNFGVAEGLPHRSVNTLLETRSGAYLVGTPRGLCQFQAGSGGKFKVYLPGNKPSENFVTALMQDSASRIWCGTGDGLFEMSSGHRFRRQQLPGPPPPRVRIQVSDIAEDADRNLWVATTTGLYVIGKDGGVQYITKKDGLPNEWVEALLLDKQGRLWAGTRGGLVMMQDGKKGGKYGVQQVYGEIEGVKHVNVSALAEGPDRAIWAGTSAGILRSLQFSSPVAFQLLTRRQGLIDRSVTALAADRAGNMWAGTEGAGVMKIQPAGFTTFREEDGLASDRVWSVLADRNGAVLGVTITATTAKRSVNIFDGARFRSLVPKVFGDHGTWGQDQILLQSRSGEWWAATKVGLCRFAPVKAADLAQTQPKACYARDTEVFRVFEDSQGRIWASAQSAHGDQLIRWDPTTNAISSFKKEGQGLVSTFAEDRNGAIWMGFWGGGLIRYDRWRFTRFNIGDGVPAGMIFALLVDSAGRLWIGSNNGGLGLVQHPGSAQLHVAAYTTAKRLASNTIYCIVEDQAGRIYACTAKGVDRLNPNTGDIKHFSVADGLAHGQLVSALRDASGNLWFATTQGLSRLSPIADQPPAIPSVRITDLRVGRDRFPVSQVGETRIQRGELQPSQNQLQVEFVGFNNESEESLRYTYKLEGGESDWQRPGREHQANYPGLAAGRYRFLVKAVNSEGQESRTPAEIDFMVLPPFWGRWWFRLSALLACGALLYGAYRYNLNRLLELERVRTRIATDLHDDIGSSLSGMAFLSEAVKQQIGTARPEAFEMASEVAVMARGLARALSDVVWSVDPRRDDLRNVITRVRQFAALLEAQGIAWSLQGPPQPQKVKLTPEQRHHLYLIFKEALNNIARHAHCASARLTIAVEDRQLRAEIADDGCGFSQAGEPGSDSEEHQGNGLRNMKLRAAQLGGRMRVDAAAGRGVRLELTVPLR